MPLMFEIIYQSAQGYLIDHINFVKSMKRYCSMKVIAVILVVETAKVRVQDQIKLFDHFTATLKLPNSADHCFKIAIVDYSMVKG